MHPILFDLDMIPDKIYTDNRGVYAELPIFSQADANVEYIRKDELIEWLLKGIEMSEICHSEYGDACAQAYQAVIDKINSL